MSCRVNINIRAGHELGVSYPAVVLERGWSLRMPAGDAAGETNMAQYVIGNSIAGGSTLTLDMSTCNLPNQNNGTVDAVVGFVVYSHASNPDDVTVKTAASNGFAALLGSAMNVTLSPGGFIAVFNPAGVAPASDNKNLAIVNEDADTAALVDLIYVARKA